jgi:putative endonuclease
MNKSTKEIGNWGEKQACKYLRSKGYKILERNFYTRAGEVDIIAAVESSSEENLSFIEVKTRTDSPSSGSAERASKSAQKFKTMLPIAKKFCSQAEENYNSYVFNFEHISVYVDKENQSVKFKKYSILN